MKGKDNISILIVEDNAPEAGALQSMPAGALGVDCAFELLGSRKYNFTFLSADALAPGCVAKARNILICLCFRALPDGRLNT